MEILSVKEHPGRAREFIAFFQKHWANEKSMMVYEDCILSCLDSPSPLPQWYLLTDGDAVVGGAGLITNDFISRGDLWPWLCALYVEKEYRGHEYGGLLLAHAKEEAKKAGFGSLYLCTDHVGYYERYGFEFLAMGYHPWGESSRVYRASL